MGRPLVTFVEFTPLGGGRERRVLFEGGTGLDVDFSIYPFWRGRLLLAALRLKRQAPVYRLLPAGVRSWLDAATSDFLSVSRRGYRILVDKDGLLEKAFELARSIPVPATPLPSQASFTELCSDFWYHALWAAKKLARGELYMAKACCDSYMKVQLRQMIEWQARSGPEKRIDTWHSGRFLEEWADPAIVHALKDTFAHYDGADIERALRATMDLFGSVGRQVAGQLSLSYPDEAEAAVRTLVDQVHGPHGTQRSPSGRSHK